MGYGRLLQEVDPGLSVCLSVCLAGGKCLCWALLIVQGQWRTRGFQRSSGIYHTLLRASAANLGFPILGTQEGKHKPDTQYLSDKIIAPKG